MSQYDYVHPQPTRSSHSPKPKSKSKYTASKIESDLRKTLSFLGRTLQNEFLNPQSRQSHHSESYRGSSNRDIHGEKTKWDSLPFDEILVRGRRKLEKLVGKYKELNPSSSERDRHAEDEYRNDRGYGQERPRESSPGNGRWQQADEVEEVESIRPSRQRSSRNGPRAPSPPPYARHSGQSRYGDSTRDANDWAGLNPEYHSAPGGYYSHSHTQSNDLYPPESARPKRKSTGLSLDKINLPVLIAHAGVILGVIEKVLSARAGGHGHRGISNSTSSSGGLHTALKVVRMVVAVTEGLKLADHRSRSEDSGRRNAY